MATNSIFLRYDKDKMNFMRALIFGASETPYAHGAFIFDIFFGENFPKEPPQVKLVTTGNALVRFNPSKKTKNKNKFKFFLEKRIFI
jgi:ubiquitin-protein ligase